MHALSVESLSLKSAEWLVLDEADQLFENGFDAQIDEIIAACDNPTRHVALFSATMPQRVEELARSVLRDPVRVSVGAPNAAAVGVDQKLVFVSNEGGKMVAMRQLIQVCRRSLVCARARHHFRDVWRCVSGLSSPSSCTCALAFVAPCVVHVCHCLCVATLLSLTPHLMSLLLSRVVFVFQEGLKPPVLVFVQSKGRAKELFSELVYDGINVDVIHSERSKKQRDDVVKQFRLGSIWVLIATDLMARGVDFKGVNMVCCGASRARPHISLQCTLDAPGPGSHDIISLRSLCPLLLHLLLQSLGESFAVRLNLSANSPCSKWASPAPPLRNRNRNVPSPTSVASVTSPCTHLKTPPQFVLGNTAVVVHMVFFFSFSQTSM